MAQYLVIFGAAVRPDGTASGSLRRRCEQAVQLGSSEAFYLATGGVGRHGPAEALVMNDILVSLGVAPERILLETEATDTLESVRFCARILHARGDVGDLLVCSSSYHNPRCAMLFRLAGFPARYAPTASDRPHLGLAKWLRYVLKEIIATPWDAALLLLWGRGKAAWRSTR